MSVDLKPRPAGRMMPCILTPDNPLFHRVRKAVGLGGNGHAGGDPRDPRVLAYDLKEHDVLGQISQMSDVLNYTTGGADSVALSRNMLITGILLVADPYQHDVSTATITVVEDAADKVISGLNITGGPTYFSVSSTLAFLKALGNLNKVAYGGAIMKENLATAVGVANQSRQAWYIHFGGYDDYDVFDATAGIPAELETSLNMNGTFGVNNLIATTAANGTVMATSNIYVILFGLQGFSKDWLRSLPLPDFRHDHQTAPTSTTSFNLLTKRWLKRTTILNLAVGASNNEPRNDANLTNVTMRFEKPNRSDLWTQIRWQLFKAMGQLNARGLEVDRNGTAAIVGAGLPGVSVIDWRKITRNPYGLNLMNFNDGDVRLIFELATLTGSLHLYHEYYSFPDPTVPLRWPSYRPL